MEAAYGTWSSPIGGAAVARDPGWMYSLVTADGGDVYGREPRPAEGAVGLVGPRERWGERAPINHVDNLRAPVIVLQGLEDQVVPPSQSEVVVEALARKGIPHAYPTFEGEQHGFRKAERMARAAEAELSFYAQVFRFELGDATEPVELSWS